MKFEKVKINKYGYYQLKNMPSEEEQDAYFSNIYFQERKGNYEDCYSEEERKLFRYKFVQKEVLIKKYLKTEAPIRFLDVGCGEGFALAYFKEKGYEVTGIDLSIYGVNHHNPDLLPCVIQGRSEKILQRFIEEKKTFDVINLDQILDMVLDPEWLLELIKQVLSDSGVLLIKVANNYSYIQTKLLDEGRLDKEYWLDEEGHPSYFNKQGLVNLCDALGFECVDLLGESFIDMNLLNEHTNYYQNPTVGKSCYNARVEIENHLYQESMEDTMEISRRLGRLGLGREIIGVFMPKQS